MKASIEPESQLSPTIEKIEKFGKYDVLVVRSNRMARRELLTVRSKLKRGNPQWGELIIHLQPEESFERIPGPMAWNLYKQLMRQFNPSLYEAHEAAIRKYWAEKGVDVDAEDAKAKLEVEAVAALGVQTAPESAEVSHVG